MTAEISSLLKVFADNANPDNVLPMKKYMKDKFDFYGIKTKERREIQKPFIKRFSQKEPDQIQQIVRLLWGQKERECHYFAIELMTKTIKKADLSFIDLFEFMIVNNSWWDTVDGIGAWIMGDFFTMYPEQILPVTKKWMDSDNIWLQRVCLLFQLKYKENTDTTLLYSYIKRLNQSKEFFIQKAIGWMLREYSKVNPESVREFIQNTELKPLSIREGSKYI